MSCPQQDGPRSRVAVAEQDGPLSSEAVDVLSDEEPTQEMQVEEWFFTEQMSDVLQKLENLQTMGASWLEQLPDHRHMTKVRNDVNDMLFKLSLEISNIQELLLTPPARLNRVLDDSKNVLEKCEHAYGHQAGLVKPLIKHYTAVSHAQYLQDIKKEKGPHGGDDDPDSRTRPSKLARRD